MKDTLKSLGQNHPILCGTAGTLLGGVIAGALYISGLVVASDRAIDMMAIDIQQIREDRLTDMAELRGMHKEFSLAIIETKGEVKVLMAKDEVTGDRLTMLEQLHPRAKL